MNIDSAELSLSYSLHGIHGSYSTGVWRWIGRILGGACITTHRATPITKHKDNNEEEILYAKRGHVHDDCRPFDFPSPVWVGIRADDQRFHCGSPGRCATRRLI